MNENITYKGSCLCESVTVETEKLDSGVGVCHCSMCRKWGGGPYLATDCGDAVRFSGEQHIGRYNSSEWAERGFCKQCGTHLFYRLKGNNQHIMPIGLFSDVDEAVAMDHQIFIDEKPHYYDFANQTKKMTGAEVFAQFVNADNPEQ